MLIYRLDPGRADFPHLIDCSHKLFGIGDNFKLSKRTTGNVLHNGSHVVEVAPESGGIWAADESQLFKPLTRASLPAPKAAVAKSKKLLFNDGFLPKLDRPFRFGDPTIGGTRFATNQSGKRIDQRLDIQVTHPVFVGDIPVVGGGGDFTNVFGHKGSLIGFSGVWRQAIGSFDAKPIDQRHADEQFRTMTGNLKIDSFQSKLAYYSAPAFTKQDFLYPVYVYSATAIVDKQRVPLRRIMIAATDFGPATVFAKPQVARPKIDTRTPGPKDKRKIGSASRRSMMAASPTRPWEAGTSWIGQSGGLAGSHDNAKGFVDEWAAAGWHIDFNWGDANAWESDWDRNDQTWVDNADFVFYTGHANQNGWVLSTPDDTFLDTADANGRYGNEDLEWMTIAACGPLQDNILAAGGGDVSRWVPAFKGMHIMMGYGAITFDNTDEGRKVAQYAKGGSTLIDAWFRTAREIQPATNGAAAPDGPDVWVGALWVGQSGRDPFNDHAWDFGSVCADPTAPTWWAAMWTTC
jgi:hypothetical protein